MAVKRLLLLGIALLACIASAQTTVTPNFTIIPAPSGGGLVFISESGTVSYCTSMVTVQGLGTVVGLTPAGTCATIGKVTTPIANWTAYAQGSYSLLLVNGTSSAIQQCALGAGGPANGSALGSCKELGAVPK